MYLVSLIKGGSRAGTITSYGFWHVWHSRTAVVRASYFWSVKFVRNLPYCRAL